MGLEPVKLLVAVPFYNAAGYLRRAVRSLQVQTTVASEILLLDDHSTDGSRAIAQSYANGGAATLARPYASNVGPAALMNYAIEYCEKNGYTFLARMDADDVSYPGRLAAQLALMRKHPHLVACGTNCDYIDSAGNVIGASTVPSRPMLIRAEIRAGLRGLVQGSMMLRLSHLQGVRYQGQLRLAEDTDFFLRLSDVGELRNCCHHLYGIQLSESSTSLRNVEENVAAHVYALDSHRRSLRGGAPRSMAEFMRDPAVRRTIREEVRLLERWRSVLNAGRPVHRVWLALRSPRRSIARIVRFLDCKFRVRPHSTAHEAPDP